MSSRSVTIDPKIRATYTIVLSVLDGYANDLIKQMALIKFEQMFPKVPAKSLSKENKEL